jgi:hypothetical protein
MKVKSNFHHFSKNIDTYSYLKYSLHFFNIYQFYVKYFFDIMCMYLKNTRNNNDYVV